MNSREKLKAFDKLIVTFPSQLLSFKSLKMFILKTLYRELLRSHRAMHLSFSTGSITPKTHTPEIERVPWNVSVQRHGRCTLQICWCPSCELPHLHRFASLPPSTEHRPPRWEGTWLSIRCPRALSAWQHTRSATALPSALTWSSFSLLHSALLNVKWLTVLQTESSS